jgi:hypothetical protein
MLIDEFFNSARPYVAIRQLPHYLWMNAIFSIIIWMRPKACIGVWWIYFKIKTGDLELGR